MIKKLPITLLTLSLFFLFNSCNKDKDNDNEDGKVLIIDQGAKNIDSDISLTYTAKFVDVEGNITTATGVSWSSSNTDVCTISSSGGSISFVGFGNTTISASVNEDGNSYSTTVPLGIYSPTVFAATPSAILGFPGMEIPLDVVYLSASSIGTIPTCTYSSDNTTVASVNSSGMVTLNSAGEALITIIATSLDGDPEFHVPVAVIGEPTIPIPVTRIEVSPEGKDLFRNETATLTAQAYDFNGDAVSETFTWTSSDPNIATVSSSGLVTPINIGEVNIYAQAQGVQGQAEIIVNPDTIIEVTPFWVDIAAGGTQQFTAQTYHITRTTSTPISGINYGWMMAMGDIMPMFSLGNISQSGLLTVDQSPMNMMDLVIAYDLNNENTSGAAMVTVDMFGGGGGGGGGGTGSCNCGSGNSDVHSITVAQGNSISLSVMDFGLQLTVDALDDFGWSVSNPELVFCSDNENIVTVDQTGYIEPWGMGTTTIEICSGTYASKIITVTVGF